MEAAKASDFWDSRAARDYEFFLLNGDKTDPVGQFDALPETILHMVTDGDKAPHTHPFLVQSERVSGARCPSVL